MRACASQVCLSSISSSEARARSQYRHRGQTSPHVSVALQRPCRSGMHWIERSVADRPCGDHARTVRVRAWRSCWWRRLPKAMRTSEISIRRSRRHRDLQRYALRRNFCGNAGCRGVRCAWSPGVGVNRHASATTGVADDRTAKAVGTDVPPTLPQTLTASPCSSGFSRDRHDRCRLSRLKPLLQQRLWSSRAARGQRQHPSLVSRMRCIASAANDACDPAAPIARAERGDQCARSTASRASAASASAAAP